MKELILITLSTLLISCDKGDVSIERSRISLNLPFNSAPCSGVKNNLLTVLEIRNVETNRRFTKRFRMIESKEGLISLDTLFIEYGEYETYAINVADTTDPNNLKLIYKYKGLPNKDKTEYTNYPTNLNIEQPLRRLTWWISCVEGEY